MKRAVAFFWMLAVFAAYAFIFLLPKWVQKMAEGF